MHDACLCVKVAGIEQQGGRIEIFAEAQTLFDSRQLFLGLAQASCDAQAVPVASAVVIMQSLNKHLQEQQELAFLASAPEVLPRMSSGCQEEAITGAHRGPASMSLSSVLRQLSIGWGMDAPSSPPSISS